MTKQRFINILYMKFVNNVKYYFLSTNPIRELMVYDVDSGHNICGSP